MCWEWLNYIRLRVHLPCIHTCVCVWETACSNVLKHSSPQEDQAIPGRGGKCAAIVCVWESCVCVYVAAEWHVLYIIWICDAECTPALTLQCIPKGWECSVSVIVIQHVAVFCCWQGGTLRSGISFFFFFFYHRRCFDSTLSQGRSLRQDHCTRLTGNSTGPASTVAFSLGTRPHTHTHTHWTHTHTHTHTQPQIQLYSCAFWHTQQMHIHAF